MRRLLGALIALPLVIGLRWVDRRFMTAVVTGEDIEVEHDVALFRAQLADKAAVAAWLESST